MHLQHLNNRLMERQRKMVSLTTAVLDLWGRCQADPTFVKANSMKENGSECPEYCAGVSYMFCFALRTIIK
jgi:hypothetical protein